MRSFLILFCFLFGSGVQASSSQFSVRKKKAINKLERRKVAFDNYLKAKSFREKKRLAVASNMKELRAKRAKKNEKARRSFRRVGQKFPVAEWRQFLKNREHKRRKIKKARTEYGAMQKQLKEVYKNKKYKINGAKEFNL